jgi:hypothetical protein
MLFASELKYNTAIDLMHRPETRLVKTNGDGGDVYYIVPGGRVGKAVAKQIMAHPLVKAAEDGMWPGLSQTWRLRSADAS